jgi:hypothetical protein
MRVCEEALQRLTVALQRETVANKRLTVALQRESGDSFGRSLADTLRVPETHPLCQTVRGNCVGCPQPSASPAT